MSIFLFSHCIFSWSLWSLYLSQEPGDMEKPSFERQSQRASNIVSHCIPETDICSYALNRVSGFYLKVVFQTQNPRRSPQSWAACPKTSVELCFRKGSFPVLSTVLCAGFCGLTLTFQPVPLPLESLCGESCVTEAVPCVLPPWMTGSFSSWSFIEGRPRSLGLWPDWFSYNSRSPPCTCIRFLISCSGVLCSPVTALCSVASGEALLPVPRSSGASCSVLAQVIEEKVLSRLVTSPWRVWKELLNLSF